MATEVTKIIDPNMGSGADYDSLYDWEAAQQGDLTGARNEIAIAKCRCTGGTADTTAVTINGWTTSATQYIKIWTDPAESYRHGGKWETGNKYRLEVAGDYHNIFVSQSHVRIVGLQIKNTIDDDSVRIIRIGTAATGSLIAQCIITGRSTTYVYGNYSYAIRFETDGTGNHYIVNNLITFNVGTSKVEAASIFADGTTGKNYIYNNTIVNQQSGYGIHGTWQQESVLKNNLIHNCATCFGSSFATGTGYNASSDGSAPGTNSRINKTFTFVDSGAGDFHLDPNDIGALGFGLNLYNDADYPFQTDIDGQDRGGSGAQWDIGADEYVSSGGGGQSVVPLLISLRRRRSQ